MKPQGSQSVSDIIQSQAPDESHSTGGSKKKRLTHRICRAGGLTGRLKFIAEHVLLIWRNVSKQQLGNLLEDLTVVGASW